MPRRTLNKQQATLQTSMTSPNSDIPWFVNFGKFVVNPDFFIYQPTNTSSQLLSTHSYQITNLSETSSHHQSHDMAMAITSIPTPTDLNLPPPHVIHHNVVYHKPTHRRASLEAVLPTTPVHSFTPQNVSRVATKPKTSRIVDDEAPKTLGAILRRMVSLDQYTTKNISKQQQQQLAHSYENHRHSSDARYRMSLENPHRLVVNQSDMIPPTITLENSVEDIDHMSQQRIKPSVTMRDSTSPTSRISQLRYRGRHYDSEPPKTLGAILKRMVSFDQYSRRSLSRAHEPPRDVRNGNIHPGVTIQEERRSRRRREDFDAQVRSVRRW